MIDLAPLAMEGVVLTTGVLTVVFVEAAVLKWWTLPACRKVRTKSMGIERPKKGVNASGKQCSTLLTSESPGIGGGVRQEEDQTCLAAFPLEDSEGGSLHDP